MKTFLAVIGLLTILAAIYVLFAYLNVLIRMIGS